MLQSTPLQVPQHLAVKFKLPIARLNTMAPVGPKYLGNFEFQKTHLSRDTIQLIKDRRAELTPIQMQIYLFELGYHIRAEAVAQYYTKAISERYWTIKRTKELKDFETLNKVGPVSKHQKHFSHACDFYKEFISWAIEIGFEYWQVAEVIERAPGTVRRWANKYGYKEYSVVRTKASSRKGSKSRTNYLEENNLAMQAEFDFINKPSLHEVRIPNENKRQSQEQMMIVLEQGKLDTEDAQRLIDKFTWKDVVKRIQNPNHLIVVNTKEGMKTFKLTSADPYNNIVVLDYLQTITTP